MFDKTLIAAALALAVAGPALAQEPTTTGPTAPDGTPAFGFDPYIGVIGGYHSFDRDARSADPLGERAEGWLVGGVAGFNIPLGPLFVGAEGNVVKGFNDIDWEYGATGRAGFRAGDSGLVYALGGYQWVNGRRGFADTHGWMVGGGVEIGPRTIGLDGLTGEAGPRLRLEVQSYELNSIRPTVGVIFHF